MLSADTSHRSRGFSILELLIALGVMAFVVYYAMAAFIFQNQTYVVVDQVSEVQQNIRGVAALLERDVRSAGYMVPTSGASCGIDNTDAPDVLYLSDADVIRPVDDLGVALAAQTLGADVASITSGTPDAIRVDDLVIDGEATYDNDSSGTAESDFQVGGGVILVDVGNPDLGVLCGTITAIGTSPPTISANLTAASWTGTATSATDVRAVPAHVYTLTSTTPPELQRDGIVVAKDVEDLQIAWFLDDGDNEVETDEYAGDATDNTYDPQGQDGSSLREVRVNLVMSTRTDDPRNPDHAGHGQETENRDTNVGGADGRRRRVHTTTMRLRNLPAT